MMSVMWNMEPRGKSEEQGEQLGYYSNAYKSSLLLCVYYVPALYPHQLICHFKFSKQHQSSDFSKTLILTLSQLLGGLKQQSLYLIILWIGNLGKAQLVESSVCIVMYSAVRWACLECSKQLHSHVWNLGSARTVDQSPYQWSLQNGSLGTVGLLSEPALRNRKWKLPLSGGLGSETYTATLLPFSAISQRSPKAGSDSRGGDKDPNSQWKVFRVFVAIFNPPQCLALNRYPINVY